MATTATCRPRHLLLAATLASCSGSPRAVRTLATAPPAARLTPVVARSPLATLAAKVGAAPRLVAQLALRDSNWLRSLESLAAASAAAGGHTLQSCGVDLAALSTLRVAIGEPLVVEAELDGHIDAAAFRCVAGTALEAATGLRLEVADRPGGVTLRTPHEERARAEPATARVARLVGLCEHEPRCVAAALGPAGHELFARMTHTGTATRLELDGAIDPAGAAVTAFVDAVRATGFAQPGLAALLTAKPTATGLAIQLPGEPDDMGVVAFALRAHLLEGFRIPSSSMAPTLVAGDDIYIAKGAWMGNLEPGMLVAYRIPGNQVFLKRIVAVGGQTVTQTGETLAVDGVPLAATLVDASGHYDDVGPDGVRTSVPARVFREQLGGRSHLVLHTGTAVTAGSGGSWVVPAGSYFVVGDNREHSNDSRYAGSVPADAILGRVVTRWYRSTNHAPDWSAIGVPID